MTVAELAALAAKVEGFERPAAVPCPCDGVGFCVRCLFSDDDDGWDNSPAALLMAVMLYARKHHGDVEMNGASVAVHSMQMGPGLKPVMRRGRAAMPGETEESIARAALVALLRANGVETTPATPETTAS